MIREATVEDIPQLVGWGAEFHKLARLPFGYDAHRTAESLGRMISSDSCVVLMHEFGFIIGALSPVWFSDAVQVAELAWWAEKDGLWLLKALEDWAVSQGAVALVMAHLEGSDGEDERVMRIYERRGYARSEIGYRKVL